MNGVESFRSERLSREKRGLRFSRRISPGKNRRKVLVGTLLLLPLVGVGFALQVLARDNEDTSVSSGPPAERTGKDVAEESRVRDESSDELSLERLAQDRRLAEAYVDRNRAAFLKKTQVSEEEVRAYYEEHRSEYLEAPRFTAHHLLVYRRGNPAFPDRGAVREQALQKAEAARTRLGRGESWEVVARETSEDAGTRGQAGLLRESSWGFLPREVETVLRSLEVGVPSAVIESPFGYHVVQVESRTLEPTLRPFDGVRRGIREKLESERQLDAGKSMLEPLYRVTGLRLTEAGLTETHLAAEGAVPAETILATLGARKVLESEFRGFVRDTVLPSQRILVFSRPHARRELLSSYLDTLVLAEMARRSGLEVSP